LSTSAVCSTRAVCRSTRGTFRPPPNPWPQR
jgi:hypothetical protein